MRSTHAIPELICFAHPKSFTVYKIDFPSQMEEVWYI